MASIVVNNLHCNVRPIKCVTRAKYGGLKPYLNLKLVCARPAKIPVAPVGTSLTYSLPINGRPHCNQRSSVITFHKKKRRSPVLRDTCEETILTSTKFVYPLFIHEGDENIPIGTMPGCFRLGWKHGLIEEVSKARDVGVNRVMLFPIVPDELKSPTGDEAYNENGLVPRAIRLLKDKYPDLIIYTDVALGPYSSHGHDGIVRDDGVTLNDETVYQLCKQAVVHARAGANVVGPSDMMDGRVGVIRFALDYEGFNHVAIMSYTTKYASSFYGSFGEALESNPRVGDKKTYQMNPANYIEAMVEIREDYYEGADIFSVTPCLPYLDIISLLHRVTRMPIAAYQACGEYSMIKAGGLLKMLNGERAMMESLMCIKRAGADIILTHFALETARLLRGEKR